MVAAGAERPQLRREYPHLLRGAEHHRIAAYPRGESPARTRDRDGLELDVLRRYFPGSPRRDVSAREILRQEGRFARSAGRGVACGDSVRQAF